MCGKYLNQNPNSDILPESGSKLKIAPTTVVKYSLQQVKHNLVRK